MGYNRENFRRIREDYQNRYHEIYLEADRRAAEVHAKSPELAALDRELSDTWSKIAMATLGQGEAAAAQLEKVKEENLKLQARRAVLLTELGYPADYTAPRYECQQCHDTGYAGDVMCECMRKKLVLAGYESSGLGQLMKIQRFDNFDLSYYTGADKVKMETNLGAMREYAETFAPEKSDSLLLIGGTGLGKTHLSTAAARRIIDRGYDVLYTGAIALFAAYERQRFGQSMTEEGTFDTDRYLACDLLIIDDLGAEVTNQFTSACLYMVVNERINRHLPTIVSTNLTAKDLKNRYADRIYSRLLGEFRLLPFCGVDVRRQKLERRHT